MNNSTEKRNITFYSSSLSLNRIERNALQLIDWLNDENNQITVIGSHGSAFLSHVPSDDIRIVAIPPTASYFNIRTALKLTYITKQTHTDILIIIRPRDIILSSISKSWFNRKLKLVLLQQSPIQLKSLKLLYRILFKPFNCWICPTLSIKNKNHKITQYPEALMPVIPPGIDTNHITADILSKSAARKLLDLPPKTFIVGISGICNPQYRADFLIRMVQFLKRNNHCINLVISGSVTNNDENEYMCFLKELAIECGVDKQVHMIPYTEKLITFLRSLDVFILNNPSELPNPILLKAMAAGTTVVATYSGYNTQLLAKGKYGILYRDNDLEDISAKIIHLLTQPVINTHLQSVALKQVKSYYDRKVIAAKYNQVFDSLLNNKHI